MNSNSAAECITSGSPCGTWSIRRGWVKAPVLRYSRAHPCPFAPTSRRMVPIWPWSIAGNSSTGDCGTVMTLALPQRLHTPQAGDRRHPAGSAAVHGQVDLSLEAAGECGSFIGSPERLFGHLTALLCSFPGQRFFLTPLLIVRLDLKEHQGADIGDVRTQESDELRKTHGIAQFSLLHDGEEIDSPEEGGVGGVLHAVLPANGEVCGPAKEGAPGLLGVWLAAREPERGGLRLGAESCPEEHQEKNRQPPGTPRPDCTHVQHAPPGPGRCQRSRVRLRPTAGGTASQRAVNGSKDSVWHATGTNSTGCSPWPDLKAAGIEPSARRVGQAPWAPAGGLPDGTPSRVDSTGAEPGCWPVLIRQP